MPAAPQSILETRRHQMFPVLDSADIERVRRFGKVRSYRAGEALVQVGTVGTGLPIILTGRGDITQHDESGHRRHIVTHGPGSFIYPTGLSGMALMAHAYNQAQKFGVEMGIPDEVTGLDRLDGAESGPFVLKLSNSEQAKARSSVIATGARYRRLAVDGLEAFEGSSVHYWASPLEAELRRGQA